MNIGKILTLTLTVVNGTNLRRLAFNKHWNKLEARRIIRRPANTEPVNHEPVKPNVNSDDDGFDEMNWLIMQYKTMHTKLKKAYSKEIYTEYFKRYIIKITGSSHCKIRQLYKKVSKTV